MSEALDRAVVSLEGITSFEIVHIDRFFEGAKLSYRVQLLV